MASFSDAAAQVALNALIGYGTWCVLCTADPGTTGANLVAGMTKLATTWGSPSGRAVTGSAVLLTIPSGSPITVTHFAIFTLQTGGSYVGGGLLTASEAYSSSGGTYSLVPTLTVP